MAVIFIGDEVTALGYRLAGAHVRVTEPRTAQAALATALKERPALVLLSAGHANAIDPLALQQAQRHARPPVLVVSEARADTSPPSMRAAMHEVLGIAR